MQNGVFERNFDSRAGGFELLLHFCEDCPQGVGREDFVGKEIEYAHYPRHVHAFAVGVERDGCGYRRLKLARGAVLRLEFQRELEVVDSDLRNGHVAPRIASLGAFCTSGSELL